MMRSGSVVREPPVTESAAKRAHSELSTTRQTAFSMRALK